jgi:DNA-binding NarL/FixJ family response regulator
VADVTVRVVVDDATGEAFAVPDPVPPVLSGREFQVLCGLADGWSYAEIARWLHLAPVTVSLTATRLYRRLGVSSAQHAVHVAWRRGLLS